MRTKPTNLLPAEFALALNNLNACKEALLWSEGMDYHMAWATCPNYEWMFFLINATAPLSPIADELLACRFAREVLHLNTNPLALGCIEIREMWARGEATDEQRAAAMADAQDVAQYATGDAARVAARDATLAAARAGDQGAAARDAVQAARGAAEMAPARDAVWAAARDAERAAWVASWAAAQVAQCDIIRELVPQPVLG